MTKTLVEKTLMSVDGWIKKRSLCELHRLVSSGASLRTLERDPRGWGDAEERFKRERKFATRKRKKVEEAGEASAARDHQSHRPTIAKKSKKKPLMKERLRGKEAVLNFKTKSRDRLSAKKT